MPPRVGALVEGPAFHPYLSGRANLRRLDAADAHADARTSKQRVDTALDRVGLLKAAGKRYRNYSLGMRQRLAIATTLLTPRDLFVLDEPTNGLDPQGTREVRALIAGLRDEGATVLVSSHLLSKVEHVCTHVGVMRAGVLVAQGLLDEVAAAFSPLATVRTSATADAVAVLRRCGLTQVAVVDGCVQRQLDDAQPSDVVAALVHAGVPVSAFDVRRPSLEDEFIALTGTGFDVEG